MAYRLGRYEPGAKGMEESKSPTSTPLDNIPNTSHPPIFEFLLRGSYNLIDNTVRCVAGLHESLQPCSRAARKWRENEEMRRKWRENEEMERD